MFTELVCLFTPHASFWWLSLAFLALVLMVVPSADQPGPSLLQRAKRVLIGKPIRTAHAHAERLPVFIGLPVFASDALSSVAYATEAVLSVLILHSLGLLGSQLWIAGAITLLIAIVAISYRQTIHAYPSGGGSYVVASENLGQTPGLIAGGALMIDYILTVAVSIAAGVAAIVSAFPVLHPYLVVISSSFVVLVAYANLRGVKESGALFAIPTYGFLAFMIVMIIVGITKSVGHVPGAGQIIVAEKGAIGSEVNFPIVFILLRSFAAGCTALTGIEAVSNGVPVFKVPEAHNAAKTLGIMATLLATLFIGTGYVAQFLPSIALYNSHNPEYRTLISQIATWTFGPGSFGFYGIQAMTAAILILAANTAFADFPRLASLLSRDGFLPRPLARQGDRLVFQNGIVLLALASIALIFHFNGELDLLLPLYAVGVFLAFTMSQAGMVVHWLKTADPGRFRSLTINAIGALATGVVMTIILVTKFSEGAWIVVILIGGLFTSFRWVKSRYESISRQLTDEIHPPIALQNHQTLILVPRIHRGIIEALEYAMGLHGHAVALHVSVNPNAIKTLKDDWDALNCDIPLVVLESPFRSLIDPVLQYVDQIHVEQPDRVVTVLVSEAVSKRPTHRLLQESVASQIKAALGSRHNVVITNIRYFLD